jgi:hypothetical protein
LSSATKLVLASQLLVQLLQGKVLKDTWIFLADNSLAGDFKHKLMSLCIHCRRRCKLMDKVPDQVKIKFPVPTK